MASQDDDRLLQRLLSGQDALSRPEQEAAFEAVYAEVKPPRARPWAARLRLAAALGGVLAAFSVCAIVALGPSEPRFLPKGDPLHGFSVRCITACRPGHTLVFEVREAQARYLSAFALRPDGRVIWYFPEAPLGRSATVSADGLLERGVQIGPEHTPGEYTIHGLLFELPLDRATVKARFSAGAQGFTRTLVIKEGARP